MAYPSSFSAHSAQGPLSHSAAQGAMAHGAPQAPQTAGAAPAAAGSSIRANHPAASPFSKPAVCVDGETAGDHQLEKLEFALAVALTRGEQQRSALLREQIAALGGNQEEPGT